MNTPIATACIAVCDNVGCLSANFNTHHASYIACRVFRMVYDFQKNHWCIFHNQLQFLSTPYLDGVSITRKYPMKHIWLLAASLSDDRQICSQLIDSWIYFLSHVNHLYYHSQ